MNFENALFEASKILKSNFVKSSILDSEILLSKVIKKDRKYINLNLDENLNEKSYNEFKKLIIKRSLGKPIAYLIGKKDFWKYEFIISEKVLIPRPDTELLIEEVLKINKEKSKLKVLDIGVGSGCILLSILKEKKDFYGVGVDISKKCIELSKLNAQNLHVTNRVKFF